MDRGLFEKAKKIDNKIIAAKSEKETAEGRLEYFSNPAIKCDDITIMVPPLLDMKNGEPKKFPVRLNNFVSLLGDEVNIIQALISKLEKEFDDL